jgi:RNA polymerase sigma-70 factor (ECF subfamily)
MDDLQAITRLKRGDIGALDTLIERYQVRAVRVAYLITQDAALAQDVVQDVFINVYRSIRTFDVRRPFAPWLMRSVVNAAVTAAKHNHKWDSLNETENDEDLIEQLPDPAATPDDLIDNIETEQQVWEALGRLAPERRTVIILRFYLELSEAEMAEHLNIPVGTVKSRLYSARRQLREFLRFRMEV